MANLLTTLKEEITRLARKELKAELDPLRKTITRHRSEIAALKRTIDQLHKQIRHLDRTTGTPRVAAPSDPIAEDTPTKGLRFSPKGLRTQRERLGLSAAELGRLFQVTAATIYNWETGKARPRPPQLTGIAQLRRMGKRDIQTILAQLTT